MGDEGRSVRRSVEGRMGVEGGAEALRGGEATVYRVFCMLVRLVAHNELGTRIPSVLRSPFARPSARTSPPPPHHHESYVDVVC
jgi:hypothetical protein